MRFRVTLKSPDACRDSIEDRIEQYKQELREDHGYTDEETIEEMADAMDHELQAEAEKWFGYGEYLTVELDTEAHTCKVVRP